jgi:hypothetical protein
MWGRKRKTDVEAKPDAPAPLREALREARVESAERTSVVVELRDAEIARLELLNEALDPLFAQIPDTVTLFDRGISPGESPRLWIDVVAHVAMGRDKRTYRLLQDTRFGRQVLAESADIAEMAAAVTKYVARRMVERERALAGDDRRDGRDAPRRRWSAVGVFVLGMICGAIGLLAAAWIVAARLHLP